MQRFQGLDGLRGVAAALVCLTHMSAWGFDLLPGADFNDLGRSGVMLFFVLSAFLLTSQVLAWNSNDLLRTAPWMRYLEARVLRIWPLFIAVVSFSLLTTHLGHIPVLWRLSWLASELPVPMPVDSYWRHIGMFEGTDILWTIAVEFKFYLVLPLILVPMLLLMGRGLSSISMLAVAVAVSAYIFPVVPNGVETLPFIGVFLTGILIAFVHNSLPAAAQGPNRRGVMWELLAWGGLAVFVAISPKGFRILFGMDLPYAPEELTLIYGLIWAAVLLGMLRGKGAMRWILNGRFFVFLGTISYSLYLWHRMPIRALHRLSYFGHVDFIPQWLRGPIVFAAAIAIAYVSFKCLEWPVQRWRSNRQARARLAYQG